MDLVRDLTDENTRLIRDNKRANASLDSMVKDIAELNNRLFDIALQSPDDGGDIFDDAFADPAEFAERADKKKKEAAAMHNAGPSENGASRKAVGGMDIAMKKRQEDTAAEVSSCFLYSKSVLFCTRSGTTVLGQAVEITSTCNSSHVMSCPVLMLCDLSHKLCPGLRTEGMHCIWSGNNSACINHPSCKCLSSIVQLQLTQPG